MSDHATARPEQANLLHRRDILANLGVGAMAGLTIGTIAHAQQPPRESPLNAPPSPMSAESLGWDDKAKLYTLPPLPYGYDDLEPHIDGETMRLHHDKHHKGYVDGLNKALAMLAEIRAGKRDAGEVKHWSRELAFHGSGHFLHVLFWNCMGPNAGGEAKGPISEKINADFGSFKNFADHFKAAANAVEGSGWGLLVHEPIADRLLVMQSEKHQDLTAWGVVPLVVCDVWEHAYYLKYKNARKDYVNAFINVVNWRFVDQHFAAIRSKRG